MKAILYSIVAVLLAVATFAPIASAGHVVGTAAIWAPAVLTNNTGSLTRITLTVTNGTGHTVISVPRNVSSDTNQSAVSAAMYATQYLNLTYQDYNFTYMIGVENESVSGPSAGAAMTVLAISALTGTPIPTNFTMTGTIAGGTIGAVGGVYDKSSAAAKHGLKFILVPATQNGSIENMLYYLTQTKFNIPLIEVPNISTAVKYAFDQVSTAGLGTKFNFFNDYHAGTLPQAPVTCSNSCDLAQFAALANLTRNFTTSQIMQIGGFPNATKEMLETENQSLAAEQAGYLYSSADISFLNYLNAVYMSGSNATVGSGLLQLDQISNFCSGLSAPQLTSQNYEWVLAGELRQTWGNYTIGQTISSYNTSDFVTDDVLSALYSGAEANGWCHASNFMYGLAQESGGIPVVQNASLAAVAQQRVNRALSTGSSVYTSTAQAALKQKNYALAMFDSEYAYSGAVAGPAESSLNTSQLLAAAAGIAANATYGAWATELANNAYFYIHESSNTANSTIAKGIAEQAYSSAVLSSLISNDTRIISQNLVQAPSTPTAPVTPAQYSRSALLYLIIFLIVVIIILDVIILFILRRLERRLNAMQGSGQRRARKGGTRR